MVWGGGLYLTGPVFTQLQPRCLPEPHYGCEKQREPTEARVLILSMQSVADAQQHGPCSLLSFLFLLSCTESQGCEEKIPGVPLASELAIFGLPHCHLKHIFLKAHCSPG